MRILIYGFGPYRRFHENITAKIIAALPKRAGLKKLVFPVRFQRAPFVQALKQHNPDIVLGLGQSSRRAIASLQRIFSSLLPELSNARERAE